MSDHADFFKSSQMYQMLTLPKENRPFVTLGLISSMQRPLCAETQKRNAKRKSVGQEMSEISIQSDIFQKKFISD